MPYSIRLNAEEERLVKSYCTLHGISVSEAFKRTLIEAIEDEFDLAEAEEAIKKYEKNPVTIPWEQVMKDLDVDEVDD